MPVPTRNNPFAILLAVVAMGLCVAAAVLFIAISQPWLGLDLAPDSDGQGVTILAAEPEGPARALPARLELVAIGETQITAADLIEEPDTLPSFTAMAQFFDRQTALHRALSAPVVVLHVKDGPQAQYQVAPAPWRDITSLPVAFWVQIAVGLISLVVGAWVWSFRRGQLSAQLLAIASLGLPLSAFPSALYSSRELALSGELFRILSALNHLGTLTFGVAMTALFLAYPVRLVPPRLLWALPAIYGALWIMDTTRTLLPSPNETILLPAVSLMVAILIGAGLQYNATRHDPVARASIRWFGLAVGLCAGSFIVIIIMPNLFGITPVISQGYAFILFALMFLGVAAGVARYRLFELESWTLPILAYFGAVAVLLLLDAALVVLVSMNRPAAFSISLVVAALLYLPLRDRVARRLMPGPGIDRATLFSRIVDVALADPTKQEERWRSVLQDAFRPLRILPDTDDPVAIPTVVEDGLALRFPRLHDLPPLRVSHPRAGRGLFSLSDKHFAEELSAMMKHAIASRDAYESGASEERLRIARDMHDSLGAQLLSALYSNSPERKNTLIRETISDLRDIVNNSVSGGRRIGELLADLKLETSQRLTEAGIVLEWGQSFEDETTILAPNVTHALRSVVREMVSNVIRHSGATTMRIQFATRNGIADLEMVDNGRGLDKKASKGGHGLSNVEARLQSLGGSLVFGDARPGLKMRARFPLAEISAETVAA